MIKAIVFDLDDTLISEKEYVKSGYRHLAEQMSKQMDESAEEIYNSLMALFQEHSGKVFNRFFEKKGINYTQEMIGELINRYRGHLPQIAFEEEVKASLVWLREHQFKLGIITDGFKEAQHQKLKAVDAHLYVDAIVVTDDLGREFWKPHPKPFQMMQAQLAVQMEEMLYVGDNPDKDFYIGKDYPIQTVRIINEGVHGNKAYREGIQENFCIHSIKEIIELVQSLNAKAASEKKD